MNWNKVSTFAVYYHTNTLNMISITNLSFRYKRRGAMVLNDVTLDLEPGRVYGLLGPNGAGKSTLLYLIAGILKPVAGSVTLNDTTTSRLLPSTLADIFLVPEEFDLPAISLSRYVELNACYYPRFSMEDLERHLSTFGMTSDVNLGQLSMGQKKKVFMAFALACNTAVLLMDEPTNGLDIPGKSAFRRFIASNMTDDRLVIISTHQVKDVDNLLDHVVMLNSNTVLASASTATLCDRFYFATTSDPKVISEALYATPSILGTNVICRNERGLDSRLDLELLFQFALENPELLTSILNNSNDCE